MKDSSANRPKDKDTTKMKMKSGNKTMDMDMDMGTDMKTDNMSHTFSLNLPMSRNGSSSGADK